MRFIYITFIIINTALSTSLLAQIPGYTNAGQWPYGQPFAIESFNTGTDDLLFYGEGTVLHIASLNSSGVIQPLSSFRTLYMVQNIAISPDGHMLAVNDKQQWISFLDISNPTLPILLGRFDFKDNTLPSQLQGGIPEGMDFLDNNTLISAVTPKGIWALDVSNAASVSVIGNYFEAAINSVKDVKILNDLAFVADLEDGLSVFDISDLSNISLVLRDASYIGANDIHIENDIAYISRGGDGVSVASISTNPSLVVTELINVDLGVSAQRAMPLPGNHLAISDSWDGQGVLIVDINNLSQPILVDKSGTSSPQLIVKDYLIVAIDAGSSNGIDNNGLVVYNTENTGNVGALQEISFSQLYESTIDASVNGMTATLTLQNGGTVVVDLTNPNSPETAQWMHKDKIIPAAVTVGNYLVAADEFLNLFIDDISDINNPVALPTYNIGFRFPTHMITIGSNQVMIAYGDELDWLNINQQGASLISHWAGTSIQRIAKDNEIVIASGATKFSILDFSVVANPVQLAQYTTTDIIKDVDIVGNYVYLALGLGGWQVWDITDPVNASIVTTIDLSPVAVTGIDVNNDTAYVATGKLFGVLTYDVINPASPQAMNAINTSDEATKVAVNDDRFVIADRNSGAIIFSNIRGISIFKNGFE